MRLIHLDQKISLYWGEAGQLAQVIATLLYNKAVERHTPRPLAIVLAFEVLHRIHGRLASRAAAERHHVGHPPKKPRLLTLRYNEVAALMLVFWEVQWPGLVGGEVQRASLNLERYIDFQSC